MSGKTQQPADPWALFRFSVIGGLLARPPAKGELQKELAKLAGQIYSHPVTNKPACFHFSTIEAWYYRAKNCQDPIMALGRKVRSDMGKSIVFDAKLIRLLGAQYNMYPQWSYQLHADNLSAEIAAQNLCENPPSYASVRRRMVERGWRKKASKKENQTSGQKSASKRFETYEIRGYEAENIHELWHLDFHECSRRVVDEKGQWHTPRALCILDDSSRLCCHIQWYLNETAEVLIHGLSQAFYKRGLPRALMTDNGSAMIAHETVNGLKRSGISHEKTLPYSPYQNGKQEAFWGTLEGRLIAMLSRMESLTLAYLNQTTQAWVEMEYNKSTHNEIHKSPLQCMLDGKDVSRPAPEPEHLQFAFTAFESRKQRLSDGTISLNGVRFEIPSRFNHIQRLHVCFCSWDKSVAWLVDKRTGNKLAAIYPQDKTKNASAIRRIKSKPEEISPGHEILIGSEPALLKKLLSDYAATGMPCAYLPKE
jgi:transposase InsO family protein